MWPGSLRYMLVLVLVLVWIVERHINIYIYIAIAMYCTRTSHTLTDKHIAHRTSHMNNPLVYRRLPLLEEHSNSEKHMDTDWNALAQNAWMACWYSAVRTIAQLDDAGARVRLCECARQRIDIRVLQEYHREWPNEGFLRDRALCMRIHNAFTTDGRMPSPTVIVSGSGCATNTNANAPLRQSCRLECMCVCMRQKHSVLLLSRSGSHHHSAHWNDEAWARRFWYI